jgi:tetratricopeptide (TPR) repeat protein
MDDQLLVIEMALVYLYERVGRWIDHEGLLRSMRERCHAKAESPPWDQREIETLFLLGKYLYQKKKDLVESEKVLGECLNMLLKQRVDELQGDNAGTENKNTDPSHHALVWMQACSVVMMVLGQVHVAKSEYHKAYPLLSSSFQLAEQAEAHEPIPPSALDKILGWVFSIQGHPDLTIWIHTRDPEQRRSLYYYHLAVCLHGLGHFSKAQDMMGKAFSFYERHTEKGGERDGETLVLYQLQQGQTAQALGNDSLARESYQHAIEMIHRLNLESVYLTEAESLMRSIPGKPLLGAAN